MTVKGIVKDFSDKSVLPYITVFVNGTTYGTQSDTLGKFNLSFPLNRKVELVFSSIGYQSQSLFYNVEAVSQSISVEMLPQVNSLKELTVTGKNDPKWNRNFERFKKSFLGSDQFADHTNIGNYWAIDFENRKSLLSASNREPLKITNDLLGYEILTELIRFEESQGNISYLVKSFYKETACSLEKLTERNEARMEAYSGSINHFLSSLAQNRLNENGFDLFQLQDNTIHSGSVFKQYKSIKYGNNLYSSPMIKVHPDSTFSLAKGVLFLIVNRSKPSNLEPLFEDLQYATTFLQVTSEHRIDKDGNLNEPLAFEISGDMNNYRFSRMLPYGFRTVNESFK